MKFRLASGLTLIVACSLGLPACSSIKMPHVWPFYKKPKAGPVAVNELSLVNADGSAATYPQYWKRNTLVIDLSGVSGIGSVTARLPEETTWPVRVAVRVRPALFRPPVFRGRPRRFGAAADVSPAILRGRPGRGRRAPATSSVTWAAQRSFA